MMGLRESVRTCFSKYATFSGRASFLEFWSMALTVLVVMLASAAANAAYQTYLPFYGSPLAVLLDLAKTTFSLVLLVLLLPTLAVASRRLNDTGRSGSSIIKVAVIVAVLGYAILLIGIVGTGIGYASELSARQEFLFGVFVVTSIGPALVFLLLILWWASRPSQPGPNKYGPPPPEAEQ